MELYPAIDLRDGGAVRLTQGDFDREQRYGDPLALVVVNGDPRHVLAVSKTLHKQLQFVARSFIGGSFRSWLP